MKREIILSVGLHSIIIIAALMASPLDFGKDPFEYAEVIKIKAVSIPEFSQQEVVSMPPPSTPEPMMVDEAIDIPIEDPTSVDKPVEIDKPKPKPEKPKPKPQKKPPAEKPSQGTTTQTAGANTEDNEIKSPSVGAGSPFAGATIDNASFDYPYWFTQAFNKIAGNFKRTVPIDGNVVCVIYFQVIKSGRVIESRVEKSSGIEGIDRDCLAAITRSAPFPPLPDEFREEIIGITLPIKY